MKLFTRKDLAYYLDRKPDSVTYYIEKSRVLPFATFGFNSEKQYTSYQLEFIIKEYFKAKTLFEHRRSSKPYSVVKVEISDEDVYFYYKSKIN